MASWSDNIEVVARATCKKIQAHDHVSEQQLAADVDMWWHLVAADLECGVIDETGEYAREINCKRKLDGYRGLLGRHSESRAVWDTARYPALLPRN